MARTVSTETRQDLLQAVRERYRGSLKDEKLRILDEFAAVTGYHRKHIIRLFNAAPVAVRLGWRARLPVYDDAVREALIVLWETSDRVCGKRLKPLIPLLVTALERHGHLTLDVTVRARVLAPSAATLDRMLRPTRASVSGQRVRRRAVPAVQKNVPVRTFAEWEDPQPGDMEADLVSHGGDSATGSFVHTLTLTDVASGWTECVALVVRDGALVAAALEQLRQTMPFPLRGFDTDNGSEFMNETVAAYCQTHGIPCTRSRPCHKNDQAWAEQKNGAVVRRLEGLAAAAALSRLYAASRLFVNFFQPSFKLASKTRVGAKVHKTYHTPETPYARLLVSAAVTDAMKDRLRAVAIRYGCWRKSDRSNIISPHWPPGRPRTCLALRGIWRPFSEDWRRPGNMARSAPPIAARPGPHVIGGRAKIRSRPHGPVYARGLKPSPTGSVASSSCACRVSSPASFRMVNCARSNAGSGSGDTPPRGNSSSRHRPRTPRSGALIGRPQRRRSGCRRAAT
jgi:integrase-like protein